MTPANTPHSLKVDSFMPLEIGRYLQDTAHLSTTQSGAYMHLLFHYWTHGPLPNDEDQLANIARLSGDAWSNAYALVKHFFRIGTDGRLHQSGADRRITFWLEKKQKAKDKASNAAKARWSKERAKREAKTDAPSIAQAMHVQSPISVVQEQEQEQNPPTPPGAAGGAQIRGASSPGITPAPQTEARRAIAGSNGDGSGVRGHSNGVAVVVKNIAPQSKNHADPPKTDSRFEPFKKEVFLFWKGQNPEGTVCPWTAAEDRALKDFLQASGDVELTGFKRLLKNRSASGINPSVLPRKWLRGLLEYSAGPLDKFKHPIAHGARVM